VEDFEGPFGQIKPTFSDRGAKLALAPVAMRSKNSAKAGVLLWHNWHTQDPRARILGLSDFARLLQGAEGFAQFPPFQLFAESPQAISDFHQGAAHGR
jgi:hypothetical protein